jgi:hypothetical protein
MIHILQKVFIPFFFGRTYTSVDLWRVFSYARCEDAVSMRITGGVDVPSMGKILITIGLLITGMGIWISYGGRLGFGRLPGDIIIQRDHWTVYIPITSGIIISLILSFVSFIMRR